MSYHGTGRFGRFDLRTGGAVQFTPTEVSSRESIPMPTGTQEYGAGSGRKMKIMIDEAAFQQAAVRAPIPQRTGSVRLPAQQPPRMKPITAVPVDPIVRAPSVPTPSLPTQEDRVYHPSESITRRGAPVIAPMTTHPIVGSSRPTGRITATAPLPLSPAQSSGPVQSDCPPGYYRPGARSGCIPARKPAPMLPMSPITTQAPPPSGPITAQGNPPSGPITAQGNPPTGPIQPGGQSPATHFPSPAEYCAANKGTLDSQGCCHSPQGSFIVVNGMVQPCPGVPVAQPGKSQIGMIAIAAGAAVLLSRLL